MKETVRCLSMRRWHSGYCGSLQSFFSWVRVPPSAFNSQKLTERIEKINYKMQSLIRIIENLKNSEIKNVIDSRIKEFSELGKKSINEIFKELCFCLLTANFSAQGGIKIQKEINNGFLTLS